MTRKGRKAPVPQASPPAAVHSAAPLVAGILWLAVLGWAGGMWWVLTLPIEKVPDIGFVPFWDKIGHCALYCVWGILFCVAAERTFLAVPRPRRGVGAIFLLAAAAHGLGTEVYQAGVGRETDFLDFLADMTGAVAACYLCFSSRPRSILKKLALRQAQPVTKPARPDSSVEKKGRV